MVEERDGIDSVCLVTHVTNVDGVIDVSAHSQTQLPHKMRACMPVEWATSKILLSD